MVIHIFWFVIFSLYCLTYYINSHVPHQKSRPKLRCDNVLLFQGFCIILVGGIRRIWSNGRQSDDNQKKAYEAQKKNAPVPFCPLWFSHDVIEHWTLDPVKRCPYLLNAWVIARPLHCHSSENCDESYNFHQLLWKCRSAYVPPSFMVRPDVQWLKLGRACLWPDTELCTQWHNCNYALVLWPFA